MNETNKGAEPISSLVDLVAILLRRRKLILIPSLAALLLAIGLGFAPKVFPSLSHSETGYAARKTAVVSPELPNSGIEGGITIVAFVRATIGDTRFLTEILNEERPYAFLEGKSGEAVADYAAGGFHAKFRFNYRSDTRTCELSFFDEDPKKAARMADAMFAKLDREATRALGPVLKDYPPFAMINATTVTTETKPVNSKALVALPLGVLILMVLLALFVDYLSRLRADPEAMEKLKSAMKDGR